MRDKGEILGNFVLKKSHLKALDENTGNFQTLWM